jgi:hypothetical protein
MFTAVTAVAADKVAESRQLIESSYKHFVPESLKEGLFTGTPT